MKNKNILYIVLGISLLVVFIIGFQIGKIQSKNSNLANFRNNQNFNRMGVTTKTANGNRMGFNSTVGEIIEKSDNSITIKLRDSGSKIVIVSNSTEVFKTMNVEKDNLKVGDNVMVDGKTNDDGTITANSLRIIDNMPIKPTTSKTIN
jgi:formylmethanofuran dehydrogenase subunit A